MTIKYTRPVYDQFDNNKLLKKRAVNGSKQMGTSYSTVRLLDYLDEIQKMRDSPHYMFGRHSLTPWYSNNFIDSMSISINSRNQMLNFKIQSQTTASYFTIIFQ